MATCTHALHFPTETSHLRVKRSGLDITHNGRRLMAVCALPGTDCIGVKGDENGTRVHEESAINN